MGYSFNDQFAADRHQTQYFEIGGNRGIYHQGWTAVTKHATPWVASGVLPAFADDVWELYGPDDWTQAHDLSAAMPERLAELQEVFLVEAQKYRVLPLDDRRVERFDAAIAGRPTLVAGTSQTLYEGMGRLTEAVVLNLKNTSHAVAAEIDVPKAGQAVSSLPRAEPSVAGACTSAMTAFPSTATTCSAFSSRRSPARPP